VAAVALQYDPAGHAMQALLDTPLWNIPAAQAVQLAWLVRAWNVPAGHLFAVEEPAGQ